jgi:hypothetical protein
MAVRDNVAFALTFLPDVRLYEYVTKLSSRLIDRGSLDGMLMTGLAVGVSNTSPATSGAGAASTPAGMSSMSSDQVILSFFFSLVCSCDFTDL